MENPNTEPRPGTPPEPARDGLADRKAWLVAVPVRIYVQVFAADEEEAQNEASEADLMAGDWNVDSPEVVARINADGSLETDVYEERGNR